MGLMGCLGCEGLYEMGVPQCPHCGTRSPEYVGTEDEVPKATTGGASNAWEDAGAQEAGAVEGAEVLGFAWEPIEPVEAVPGEEDAAPVMLGTPGAVHGAEGLEVLKVAAEKPARGKKAAAMKAAAAEPVADDALAEAQAASAKAAGDEEPKP